MTKENLVTAPENTTLDVAEKILTRNKVEKLLLVDDQFRLKGLITIKDIDKTQKFPNACKDARGRLKVGAAIGVHDFERAASLIEAGVDVLVVDSAHGHSRNVIETVRELKKRHAIDVIAGNVATAEGATALAEAGADCVKAGIGPGAICTTRIVSGVGVPQMSAIANVARGLAGTGIPLIADGGIRYSRRHHQGPGGRGVLGDDRRAVRRAGREPGADDPVPRAVVQAVPRHGIARRDDGRQRRPLPAGRVANPAQPGNGKLVPEGVEGRVPYKGHLAPFVYQLVGGLRAGMGYCGCKTLEELRSRARFIQVTAASVQESHPHDIAITQEAPNYSSTDGGSLEGI